MCYETRKVVGLELLNYVKQLHRITGRLNLYLSVCCQNDRLDMHRVKQNLFEIKQIISKIDIEIENNECK